VRFVQNLVFVLGGFGKFGVEPGGVFRVFSYFTFQLSGVLLFGFLTSLVSLFVVSTLLVFAIHFRLFNQLHFFQIPGLFFHLDDHLSQLLVFILYILVLRALNVQLLKCLLQLVLIEYSLFVLFGHLLLQTRHCLFVGEKLCLEFLLSLVGVLQVNVLTLFVVFEALDFFFEN